MIRLVVNADDLGLHPRIDEGIFRAHREGIVTSATVLVTAAHARAAIATARAEGLALGVHLCLSTRLPPAAPPDRVRALAPQGRFRAGWPEVARAWALGQLPREEVELELRAQISRARELGARPDHLDAHQHLHLLPGIRPMVERIAREENLPLRWPAERPSREWLRRPGAAAKSLLLWALANVPTSTPARRVRSVGIYEAGALDERRLLALVRALGPGDYELGCHPGLHPGVVPEDPSWRYGWEVELRALTSARVREELSARQIQLTTFADLDQSFS